MTRRSHALLSNLAVAASVAILPIAMGTMPAVASVSASTNEPSRLAPSRPLLTLAQAPKGLQTAVRQPLGVSSHAAKSFVQQAELTASDGVANDYFGVSVAVSGSTAVVGAWLHNSSTGAAYVYVRSGATWSQQAELTASDGTINDYFGYSVAISGSTVVVGADGKNARTGGAYVFVRSGTAWSQEARLIPSDGVVGDYFGQSVAISGSTLLVGARYKNSETGAAYVFVRSGTTWSQQTELTASDGVARDDFGSSVALSGGTAVIGASDKNSQIGAAYVFVGSGAIWSQQAELNPSDGARSDLFGLSVAVSADTAVVGAFGKDTQTGAAYVYARSGTSWSQQAELIASDGATGDEFGASVALSGSTVLVGAWLHNSRIGAAYVYVRSPKWTQEAELTASDGALADEFGVSVAISDTVALVGAWHKNSAAGAAYAFTSPTVIPPTVTSGPYLQLNLAAQVGSSPSSVNLPVTVGWRVSAGSSAVCSTLLQRSVNGGPWTSIPVPNPTATSTIDTLTATGDHYQYEVSLTDCDGGTTGWQVWVPYRYNLLQESASQWTYSPPPSWKVAICSQCSEAYARYTTAKNAFATLTVYTAYNVGLVMETGPTRGSADVYVDGKLHVVNTYASTVGYRLVEFKAGWPTYGPHTIQVTNLATAGHPRVDIDAAVVIFGP